MSNPRPRTRSLASSPRYAIAFGVFRGLALLLGATSVARAQAAAPAPAGPPRPGASTPAGTAAGQTTTSTSGGASIALSLKDTLSRADARSPEAVLARSAVREAQAQRVGAGVIMPTNPRVQVDGRPLYDSKYGGEVGQLGYGATVDMLFEVGGAPRARVREAERAGQVATADASLERLRVRAAAWKAYLQVRVAETRLEETNALVAIAERFVRASKQRASMGASGDIEESLATADLGLLRASIESAIRQREEHLSTLRDILDLPPEQPILLTTALEDPPSPPDKEMLLQRAVQARPELAQVKARIAFLDARHERLNREIFPKVGGYLGVDASPANPAFGMVGVSIELPWPQRNQGPRAVTEAARATEVSRQELIGRRIFREVNMLHAAYEQRRAELKHIAITALPAAERTLELVEVGWLAGRFDVFRVATAARDIARLRAARLDALEAAWLTRIDLDRAAGGLPE